jgi:hypothetical protein
MEPAIGTNTHITLRKRHYDPGNALRPCPENNNNNQLGVKDHFMSCKTLKCRILHNRQPASAGYR